MNDAFAVLLTVKSLPEHTWTVTVLEVASRAWSFLTVAVLSCVVQVPAVPGKLSG